MKLCCRLACAGLWLAVATGAGAGEPPAPRHLVIIQERVPVQFGDNQVGELAEGTRVELHDTREGWCKIRAIFGQNWLEGWVRAAFTAPDSLAGVAVRVAPTRPRDVYSDPVDTRKSHILPGQQFLEVKVKFEPSDKTPPRAYVSWANEKTADLYLRYGRDAKLLPYGFLRRVPGMTRPVFELEEKRQTLLLKPNEVLYETYVFAIPIRARDFDFVIKDAVVPVPITR